MSTITAQDVLDALDKLDKPAPTDEPAKPVVAEPAKPVVVEPAKPAEPVKPSGSDEALALAWDMAEDAIKARCPDLDDEARKLAKDAAGGSPVKFKQIAQMLQGKITKAKEGAPVNTQAALEAEAARKILAGAPAGGDAVVVQGAPKETAAQKVASAAGDPAQSGRVFGLLVDAINEEKLLKDTTIIG